MIRRSRRLSVQLATPLLAVIVWACTLNPQPLPPGFGNTTPGTDDHNADASTGGGDFPADSGNFGSDAGPTTGLDSGGQIPDASSPPSDASIDGAVRDAGADADGGSDAASDGGADAEADADNGEAG